MDIIISTINFKADNRLEEFIKKKVGKLFNHSSKIIRASVMLRKVRTGVMKGNTVRSDWLFRDMIISLKETRSYMKNQFPRQRRY